MTDATVWVRYWVAAARRDERIASRMVDEGDAEWALSRHSGSLEAWAYAALWMLVWALGDAR